MYRKIILPASLLAETIIGAGMFALPFIFTFSGIGMGLFYLLLFGGVLALLHLIYADIILRTPENHRLLGYADIYLGESGFWSGLVITILGTLFILTIYLVLSVSFINLLIPSIPDIYKLVIFWLLASVPVFLGINKLATSEFLILLGTSLIIFIIFGFSIEHFSRITAYPIFDFKNSFLPYGAILFSMYGRSAIPAVLGYFRNNGDSPAKARLPIILGTFAPVVVYALFVFGILGLSEAVSDDAVTGLIDKLPFSILAMLAILGILEIWSTYIVIARDMKKSLEHDLNFPFLLSGAVVVFVPLFIYFAGFQNFMELVGFVGSIFIGLEGILLILMWRKAAKIDAPHKIFKKANPLIVYALILVFILGIVYKLVY